MATQSDSNALAGTRVLIVEDEYYLADDLSRTLARAGAKVVGPVGTLADAVRLVEQGEFDCAVVDMNLRGDFAYELADRLHGMGVPLLVATGYNRVSLPEELKDVPRIEKPFSPDDLVKQLSSMRSGEFLHT